MAWFVFLQAFLSFVILGLQVVLWRQGRAIRRESETLEAEVAALDARISELEEKKF